MVTKGASPSGLPGVLSKSFQDAIFSWQGQCPHGCSIPRESHYASVVMLPVFPASLSKVASMRQINIVPQAYMADVMVRTSHLLRHYLPFLPLYPWQPP